MSVLEVQGDCVSVCLFWRCRVTACLSVFEMCSVSVCLPVFEVYRVSVSVCLFLRLQC